MSHPHVDLVGDFDSAEARFLRSQFDDCRIDLIARSKIDRRTALLRWQPAAGVHTHAIDTGASSVTDRRRRPLVAWYVLEHEPDVHLAPIASGSDLHEQYPGHFDGDAVPVQPTRKGCWPLGWWPWAPMVAVAPAFG